MKSKQWKTPTNRIGTEVARREVEGHEEALIVMIDDHRFPIKHWFAVSGLVRQEDKEVHA